MPTIDEKRVYTDNTDTETVFVATSVGVVSVSVSDELVGGFGVAHRCSARDVAVERGRADPRLAAAAEEDVFVAAAAESSPDDPESAAFAATGFGPASAVGFDGATLYAADDDGRVARFEAAGEGENAAGGSVGDGAWETVGTVGAVRALDGDLAAAGDGVHRVTDDGLSAVGLDDARDVVAGGSSVAPLAATGTGLFRLGNGWMEDLSGAFDAVAASADGREHAVGGGDLFARSDGEWAAAPLPVDESVAAVAHGVAATYAVTDAGTFLVAADGNGDGETGRRGWRHQVIGLRDVGGVAVA